MDKKIIEYQQTVIGILSKRKAPDHILEYVKQETTDAEIIFAINNNISPDDFIYGICF